ncbi:MAG TPA: aldo/keto reductase [Kofleriaceae bacterium]|nr:aldo/keto reductase [Kofleriaceae bacterium]
MWTRRSFLGALATTVPVLANARPKEKPVNSAILTRPIPSTGEQLPVIGLGSWQTFDVDNVAPVQPVLARFLALGGRVVDSSPMYGKSEAAIGKMLAAIENAPAPFLATKVWTSGKAEGVAQMKRSLQRFGVAKLDLMQIHNLVDWKTHLATLRAWKEAGTIRYIGITHYAHSAFDEMEKILKTEKLDFVQLPYSVAERGAEKRLLPAAAAAGAAVLVMEPFASGALFTRVKGKALPAVAKELGCTTWAQLFLKFIVGHPAVTCPIPATSKLSHLEDNLGALRGPLPTDAQRKAIAAAM